MNEPKIEQEYKPKIEQVQAKHVYMCITGQVGRLILSRKVETLLDPIKEEGYTTHVALLLSDSAPYFTNANPEEAISEVNSYRSAVEFLEERDYVVLTEKPTTQPKDPIVSEAYRMAMETSTSVRHEFRRTKDTKILEDYNTKRVQNHARQFDTLNECYVEMEKAEERLNIRYELILRIRDDAAFEDPWRLSSVTPIPNNTVMATDCRNWFGMNDRFALLSRSAAEQYFTLPARRYKALSHPGNCSKSTPAFCLENVRNPESFLEQTYRANGLTVNATSSIRHVLKYTSASNKTALPHGKDAEERHCDRPYDPSKREPEFQGQHNYR